MYVYQCMVQMKVPSTHQIISYQLWIFISEWQFLEISISKNKQCVMGVFQEGYAKFIPTYIGAYNFGSCKVHALIPLSLVMGSILRLL